MADELKSRLTKAEDLTDPNGNTVGGLSDLQARHDDENEQGFRGVKVDPLPNELYSQETDPTMSPGHDRRRFAEWDPARDPNDPTTPTGPLLGVREAPPANTRTSSRSSSSSSSEE